MPKSSKKTVSRPRPAVRRKASSPAAELPPARSREAGSPNRRAVESRVASAIKEISTTIRSRSELDKVLQTITEEAVACFPCDICSIMLMDDRNHELIFSAQSGMPEWDARRIRFKIGEGVAGWVARHGKSACIDDVSQDKRYLPVPGQRTEIKSMCCVPLMVGERVIGVLSMTNGKKTGVFGEKESRQFMLLASQISLNIENHRLYELSVSDGLTQLYNRQYFEKRFPEEISYARRFGESVSLCMIDIDHFKKLNDTRGHLTGDLVLSRLSARLKENLREYDILARYGGEEFAMIAANTPRRGAGVVADRLRQVIERLTFPAGNDDLKVTVSIGVASFPDDGTRPAEILAAADQALYAAKGAGRNCVVVASGQAPVTV